MTGYARQDRPSEANVVAQVVRHDVCVGCGICAAVCPVNALRIQFDPRGELQPQLIGPCTQCRKCLGVCPFGPDAGNDEDSLGRELLARQEGACHDNILGWYLTCLVGHVSDPRRRWSRSSGGLASWILGALLERRLVDRVVCVIPNDDPQQLFRFAVLDRPEQVWSAANSCYYPVEVSEALRRVCQTPGRTAVVGLPCVLKGLRRWARMDGAWQERLAFAIGLACGGQRSKLYAEAVIRLLGLESAQVRRLQFRTKQPGVPAGQYAHSCSYLSEGPHERSISHSKGPSRLWTSGCFRLNACDYCDDIFAELADVSLMDAWLDPYQADPAGTSLAVVRSTAARKLLELGAAGRELVLSPIEAGQIIRSQSGVVRHKRDDLAARLHLASRSRRAVPPKRVAGCAGTWAQRRRVAAAVRRVQYSKQAFLEYGAAGEGLSAFEAAMARMQRWDRLLAWALGRVSRLARFARRLGASRRGLASSGRTSR